MKARIAMCTLSLAVSLALLALAGSARAQTFPADRDWIPFRCGNQPMRDGLRDQSAAIDERDLVGDLVDPAGFHASDQQFLYLRLRVDDVPTRGANLRPFAWGFAFSTKPIHQDYEVLVTVDGDAARVGLYRNSVIGLPNSPADPADDPPVATYPFATHGRTLAAATSFGNSRDHFIDMAVPWTALTPLGIGEHQSVVVWAASSSLPDRLDGDFACHDARGGSGVPDLSDSASDSDPADGGTGGAGGTGGSGGSGGGSGGGTGGSGGSGSGNATGPSLEGGPSCNVASGQDAPGSGCALLLALLAWLRARLRR